MKYLLVFILASCGWGPFKKDTDPKPVSSTPPELVSKFDLYKSELAKNVDSHGLVVIDGSIGDSAIFSCLARSAGAIKFDVSLLFTAKGKPIRHPDILPKVSKTPISRDMVEGILWCLLTHEDKTVALDIISKMISYGRANSTAGLWIFCDADDVKDYKIESDSYVGRCTMTPGVMKDAYRVAKILGYDCDTECTVAMGVGVNLPNNPTGFERHLAVLTTVRNGITEGAINDNSLKLLDSAAASQPNNALYLAAYHLFKDGDQSKAFELLGDLSRFPSDRLPSATEYCTGYLYQRDELEADGSKNPDWLPCSGSTHSGADFMFAYYVATKK